MRSSARRIHARWVRAVPVVGSAAGDAVALLGVAAVCGCDQADDAVVPHGWVGLDVPVALCVGDTQDDARGELLGADCGRVFRVAVRGQVDLVLGIPLQVIFFLVLER